MLKQLEKEAEEDEEIYDQLACWCETNDKEKTKSIGDAESKIEQLTTAIEDLTAGSARLNTEIKNLEKEVAENQEALDQATEIRQKELAEFNAEEKDLLGSISALKSAVTVLSKHNSASLLQIGSVSAIKSGVQAAMEMHADLLKGVFTHKQQRAVTAFLQSPQDYFDAEPTFKQSYAPQSGEIFGILKQMKETFEANLAQTQKDEQNNQKAYEKLAQSKEDLEDTKKSLAADEEFLAMLKEKCSGTDAEWEERQKTRQLEMEACSKALAVLSSDDAHDLFTKTFNPAFVQTSMTSERRSKAAAVLSRAADKVQSPRLAAIAMRVRLDAFEKVKKAIDDMVSQLLKEKEDEIKHKDFCVEEFNTNQLQTEEKEREKSDLIAKIEDLEMTIKTLTADIERLKSEISESQVQMKRAGEDREKQNKEFQQTVADQRT